MKPVQFFVLTSLFAALFACTDPWTEAKNADTIESLEAYGAANPTSMHVPQMNARLEELYFAQIESDKSLPSYETYIEKMPKGRRLKKVKSEYQTARWDAIQGTSELAGWKGFLDDFPKADKSRKLVARAAVAAIEYGKFEVSEPAVGKVNMAEDPKGEMNGWGITSTITNAGDKTISYVNMTLEYQDDSGKVLATKDWPAVSPSWPIPVVEEAKRPMKPGSKRDWKWTVALDGAPKDWNGKVRLYVSGARIAK